MIKGTAVKNGKLRLVLTGEDDIDKAALKALDGATAKTIKDNLRIFDYTVAEGLVLEIDIPTSPTKNQQNPT